MTLVVNLFAGPGAGKSTLAYGLAHKLKSSGQFTAELVMEFPKDLTWEGAYNILANYQPYVFGVQYFRIARLEDQVDCIICDSPLPQYLAYGKKQPLSYRPFVMDIFGQFENLNFFVERVKPYEQVGRAQTEDEAKKFDSKIKTLLYANDVKFDPILGSGEGCDRLYKLVYDELSYRKFYDEALDPKTRDI